MADSKNKHGAREFIESLRVEDIDRCRAVLTEDMSWVLPPSTPHVLGVPEVIRGRDAVIQFNENLFKSVYTSDKSKKMDIHHLVEDGDMVAAVFTLKTKTPAGKPYQNEYVYLLKMRDGKVAECTTYTDTAHVYEEMVPKK